MLHDDNHQRRPSSQDRRLLPSLHWGLTLPGTKADFQIQQDDYSEQSSWMFLCSRRLRCGRHSHSTDKRQLVFTGFFRSTLEKVLPDSDVICEGAPAGHYNQRLRNRFLMWFLFESALVCRLCLAILCSLFLFPSLRRFVGKTRKGQKLAYRNKTDVV